MPDTSAEANEIRFRADVWRVMEGTRATTFNGGTLTSGSFTASAYNAGTTTAYFSPTTINWVTDKWVFSDGKYYWPSSGDLDFFAYMPATKPSYISDITYAVSGSPATAHPFFICSGLPMTYKNAYTDDKSVEHAEEGQGSSMQEFVYALTTGQNKADQGASGVTMSFKRPFARINFKLSASHPDIIINSITLKGLKTGGTCTFDGSTSTWSSLTPADNTSDFVMSLYGDEASFSYDASAQTIGVPYLMVPQSFAGGIEVDATWKEWDEDIHRTVTATLPVVTWQAGYSYTYTFTITENDLKVSTEKYTEQW